MQKKPALAVLALSLFFAGSAQAVSPVDLVERLYANPVPLCQQHDNSPECVRQLERMLSWMTPEAMGEVVKATGNVPALRGVRPQDVAAIAAAALVETDRGRSGSIYGALVAGSQALENYEPVPTPAGLVVQFSEDEGASVYRGMTPYYTPSN